MRLGSRRLLTTCCSVTFTLALCPAIAPTPIDAVAKLLVTVTSAPLWIVRLPVAPGVAVLDTASWFTVPVALF